MTTTRPVFVNGAFRPQRITGQQRYATELADRLVTRGAVEIRPGRFWAASSLRTWLWSLTVLPVRSRRGVLVSLTARAPLWHPRHLLTVHDLFVLTDPEWYSRRYVYSHIPIFLVQLRSARGFVAVSEPVAASLEPRLRGRSVAVAPNAPSAVFVGADGGDGQVLARLGLTNGSYLVTVGSMDPRKNLARLAEAWAAVPEDVRRETPLVVVGGGSTTVFKQGAVEWPTGTLSTGYISDEDLAQLYAGARAFVSVSLAEGFGLPIVEAAAAGTRRFVLSDIPVYRWVAGDDAVYVDPLDPAAIARALERVHDDRAPEADVSADRFRWDESAARVLAAASAL